MLKNLKINKGIKMILVLSVVFLLGFFTQMIMSGDKTTATRDNSFRHQDPGEMFTNPLLDCADLSNLPNGKVFGLRDEVVDLVEKNRQKGTISDGAVYFRDLNNGPWFGYNEKNDFYPASLLKVPLMIAAYREEMQNPGFLQKKFRMPGNDFNEIENYKVSSTEKEGRLISVGEALESMIKFSDNNSAYLLSREIDKKVYSNTYEDLGIGVPNAPDYVISVRTYASFFRLLYNSTYISRQFSEQALKLLSEVDFKDGIVAGVPPNIRVSHKFGEREVENGVKQLHDCGIVYSENYPYLICVMTRGKDYGEMAKVVAEISRIVYDGVEKN